MPSFFDGIISLDESCFEPSDNLDELLYKLSTKQKKNNCVICTLEVWYINQKVIPKIKSFEVHIWVIEILSNFMAGILLLKTGQTQRLHNKYKTQMANFELWKEMEKLKLFFNAINNLENITYSHDR